MPKNQIKSSNKTDLFWLAGWIVLIGLRVLVLAVSPLSLVGDEAQYWQWSTTPDWGYFSKPPLIAWIIGISTQVWGDTAFGVRFVLPLVHGIAAFFLWLCARRLWPQETATAKWVVGLYLLMPGVFLSSFLMTTDALLLPLAAFVLYCFFRAVETPDNWTWMGLLGLAIGVGMLAKYAMLFLVAGLIALVIFDRDVRKKFISWPGTLVLLIPLVLLLPNWMWNQAHGFATLSHTAANMEGNVGEDALALFSRFAELFAFWGGQFGLFGPVSFGLLIGALIGGLRADRSSAQFRLAILCVVPLLIISAQAFTNRAHANWAVIAYIPGTILLAKFAVTRFRQRLLLGGMVLHLLAGLLFLAVMAAPLRFQQTPVISLVQPFLGWQTTRKEILKTWIAAEPDFAAIVTDTRLLHYSLSWQLRDQPDIELKMWPRYAQPHSHRELMQPLSIGDDRKVLLVIGRKRFGPRVLADFHTTTHLRTVRIQLAGNQVRSFDLYEARGFFPQKRNAEYEARWRHLDTKRPKPTSLP